MVRIHGLRAAEAALTRRPEAVVRAYVDEAQGVAYGEMMRTLATHRIAYRLVPAEEMERVSGSWHHEGICLLVKPRPEPEIEQWIRECPAAAAAIVLEDVRNPHNLGAIVRMAAHFGVTGIWSTAPMPHHGALARVAEGGIESVDMFYEPSAVRVITRLRRAGFVIAGAKPRAETPLYDHRLSRRVAFVMGSEQDGLSPLVEQHLDVALAVPGTGAVESLNVSVATSLFVSEYARQRSSRRAAETSVPADEG